MVYKRYYSPFEEPKVNVATPDSEIIKPKKIEKEEHFEEHFEEHVEEHIEVEKTEHNKRQSSSPFDFMSRIGYDDLIIVGIIIVLLMEDKENRDIPLILSLGFLLLIEYIEAD